MSGSGGYQDLRASLQSSCKSPLPHMQSYVTSAKLMDEHRLTLNKMHAKVVSLAANFILADVTMVTT
jgi:hypothetical protein